jgi:hypothetical protein
MHRPLVQDPQPRLIAIVLPTSIEAIMLQRLVLAQNVLIFLPRKLDPLPRVIAIAKPAILATPGTAQAAEHVLMVARLLLRHPQLLLRLLIASVR